MSSSKISFRLRILLHTFVYNRCALYYGKNSRHNLIFLHLDIDEYFKERSITYISAQDMITPQSGGRQFGLYAQKNDEKKNLAMSIYHWGAFYEELINSIMRGSWKVEESGESKALNYWWGLKY